MIVVDDIKDTEIRLVTQSVVTQDPPNPRGEPDPPKRQIWKWIFYVLISILLFISAYFVFVNHPELEEEVVEEQVFEPVVIEQVTPHSLLPWMESFDHVTTQGTAIKDTIVNDIPIRVLMPLNATPRLEIGYDCIDKSEDFILAFQAADIRADNKKIVGAFVLRGQPLSWGLSKRGYCSIIDDKITVGVADNTPLFEQATEQGGYFFRQYPLVDEGRIVESELKTKATRRALCEVEGRIVVMETETRESMHDFSQALVDLNVRNAVYLVGSASIGYCRKLDNEEVRYGAWKRRPYKNVSFIVWSK